MISTGEGRTTCSYFLKDGKHILYAGTQAADKACPPLPEARKDNVITIVVPDAWLGEIKEIEQLIKDTISTSYSGCEIK